MIKKFRPVFTNQAIVLAAALLITLPLRTVQHLSNIEAGTGFYKRIDANIVIYGILLAAAMAYFIVTAFMKRKKVILSTAPEKLPGCGVLAFLAAAAVGYSAFLDFKGAGEDASAYTVSSTVTSAVNGPLATVQLVFGGLTAVFFILLAIVFLSGKSASSFKLLSLAPVLWLVLKLVSRFTRTISYIRVSDLAMEMIAAVFLLLFFMAFAQTNSNVEAKGNEWKLAGFGFPAALLCLNMFIPRLVTELSSGGRTMYILSRADFADLAVALFIIATVLTRISPETANITVKTTQGEAAE